MKINIQNGKSFWVMNTLCAFANAQGGVLEIGKNDKGQFAGLTRANAS